MSAVEAGGVAGKKTGGAAGKDGGDVGEAREMARAGEAGKAAGGAGGAGGKDRGGAGECRGMSGAWNAAGECEVVGAGDGSSEAGLSWAQRIHAQSRAPSAAAIPPRGPPPSASASGAELYTAGGASDAPCGDRPPPCGLMINTSASCLDPAAASAAPPTHGSSGSSDTQIPGGALLDWSPVPIFGKSRSSCIQTAINFARSSTRSSTGKRLSGRNSNRYSDRCSDKPSDRASDRAAERHSSCLSGRHSARRSDRFSAGSCEEVSPDYGPGAAAGASPMGLRRLSPRRCKVEDAIIAEDAQCAIADR